MKLLAPLVVLIAAIGYGLFFVNEDVHKVPERHHHVEEQLTTNTDQLLSTFSKILAFKTVCDRTAPLNVGNRVPFQQLLGYLPTAFPKVFNKLALEKVNEFSLLFTWQGKDQSLNPIVLMSHYDVVPALQHTVAANWTHDPFSGTIENGYIWGRGTLDTKSSFSGILQAVEELLTQGFTPERTILLAFGHDEEVGGEYGAKALSELLQKRGVSPEFVLDEGGMILSDGLKAGDTQIVNKPVAMIGTAEKGYQTWKIHVFGKAGHSSVPPTGSGTSVSSRMGKILTALEKQQTSTTLQAPVTDMLRALAPHMKWAPLRALLLYADNAIIRPALGQLLGGSSKEMSAVVRSTVAVVSVKAGGGAENILPGDGEIVVNFRTLGNDNTDDIHQYLISILGREAKYVALERITENVTLASSVSPASGPQFDLLKRAIEETIQGELVIVPYLCSGMTDSRYYDKIAPGRVYRFSPVEVTSEAVASIHGADEKLSVESYLTLVRFFIRFIKLSAAS